jgi:hypothetical protein
LVISFPYLLSLGHDIKILEINVIHQMQLVVSKPVELYNVTFYKCVINYLYFTIFKMYHCTKYFRYKALPSLCKTTMSVAVAVVMNTIRKWTYANQDFIQPTIMNESLYGVIMLHSHQLATAWTYILPISLYNHQCSNKNLNHIEG